ncbi:MAG TPA: hypothetical protein VKC60_17770, partial [Opitutaceae bacterium]|nr:hypothetical protein [Opitutaceae bacterium]
RSRGQYVKVSLQQFLSKMSGVFCEMILSLIFSIFFANSNARQSALVMENLGPITINASVGTSVLAVIALNIGSHIRF